MKNMEGDKTRRKRLKVVSACGECRRKKTKCNGEKPCAGCLKARVECKYVNSNKSTPTTTTTTTINSAMAVSSNSNVTEDHFNKLVLKPSVVNPTTYMDNNTLSSIESIEERLRAIENILRALLGSGKNKHLLQGLQQQRSEPIITPNFEPSANSGKLPHSSSLLVHSDTTTTTTATTTTATTLCGDMYSSPRPVHAPHVQNRLIPREKRQRHEEDEEGGTENKSKRMMTRNDFGHGYCSSSSHFNSDKLQLAPIKIINHTPTIRNLLNNEENGNHKPRWYPSSKVESSSSSSSPPLPNIATSNSSSAFFRISSARFPNDIIANNTNNNNSAPTAAGTS
ncbi:hypothetical protein CU098_011001 [Rhizopus stolonifer]|uniref:Zn(2)-C6 fungal-type domain-containing protein n=1 Tax=Rhizopus stolonifer TaxID=4846 RepID=A0A367KMP1_RHIST|nr:hypothetical protein CU098_011001 [Rhizopus stolonifer]